MPLRQTVISLVVVLLLAMLAPAVAGRSSAPPAAVPDITSGAGFLPTDVDRLAGAESADLRRPEPPTDAYRPRFVRQTGKNCAFASAAMLIDKWTSGTDRPAQERLRRASRVPDHKGVNFAELSRAVGRATGIDLRYSPGGGDPLTWPALLSRLERGGAAIVGGAYSRLPRHYQRWARDFASGGAAASGHAVYVERYERKGGGRVWMMDPLAKSAGYTGEWISTRALRQYAWRNTKGLVTAAATPEPPPLAGYRFGVPQVGEWARAGQEVTLMMPVTITAGWLPPRDLGASVEWRLIEAEPTVAEAGLPVTDSGPGQGQGAAGHDLAPRVVGMAIDGVPVDSVEPASSAAAEGLYRLKLDGEQLLADVTTPAAAGLYELAVTLHWRDGTDVAGGATAVPRAEVRLRGEYAAELSLLSTSAATRGGSVTVELAVTNHGSAAWTGESAGLVASAWRTALGSLPADATLFELDAGETATITLVPPVPTLVDEGQLNIELRTADGLPLELFGAQPLVIPLRFFDPAGS